MVDTFPSSNARQDLGLFVVPIVWNNNCDGLADRLVGRVTKDAFGPLVPACDYAIEILADNCVVASLDDGSNRAQTQLAFFNFGQERFGSRDVAVYRKHGVITEQLHAAIYNDFSTVLAGMP